MGYLTDDMTRLRGEIDALRGSRVTFVNDLEASVLGMRVGFSNDHKEMAEKMKDELSSFRNELAEMAKLSKAERLLFIADTQKAVLDIRDETNTLMSLLKSDHAEMAEGLRETLVNDDAQRKQDAWEAKKERKECVADLVQKTSDFRAEFAADVAGARQAWFGVSQTATKPFVKEKKESKIEQVIGQDEILKILKTEETIVADDLTQIKEIGPGREKQLNNGGVYTFSQLAGRSIKDLEEILGESAARIAPLDKWIEQAKKLKG